MIPPSLTHLEHVKMFAYMLYGGDICQKLHKFRRAPAHPNYMINKKTLYLKYLSKKKSNKI